MLIGAHVSISGGIDKAIERAKALGVTCIQTFASPPRTLQFFPYTEDVISAYHNARNQSLIQLHVFHAVYLVNLASDKPDYVKASIHSLIQYQQAATQLRAIGTIFHIGSHKGNGFDTVKTQIGQAIATILSESPISTSLIIENAAGLNGTVGQTIDEVAYLFDATQRAGGNIDRLGLCLDTQHAFASGIDARDQSQLDRYLSQVDHQIGLSHLQVIHCNDSKVTCNAHKDRHENIGLGELGNQGIKNWLTHPQLCHLPFILEVPGIDKKGPGKVDVEALLALL